MEESLVFSVLRTLPAHSECLCREVRLDIESWLQPCSYWPVEKTVCFALFCFSDCDDHICSLSFLFHRDLVYKGPRDCRISTRMTEDRTPRELAGSAPWGAKGGVFGAAAQAQELRPGLERSRPALGKLQKHTCSVSNGIQALALFLPTQKFSCFLGGFLVALSAALLPFHSGLLSAFLSRFQDVKVRAAVPVPRHHYFLARCFGRGINACKRHSGALT